MEAVALKENCVADAQAAPTHEKRKGAETGPGVLNRDVAAARIAVHTRRIENSLELIGREMVGRNLNDLDPSEAERRIFDQVAAAHTGPEEADHTALLLLFGERAVLPHAAEVEQGIEIDLIDILESLRLGPGEELLIEDGLKLVERGLGHVATDRILEVGFDSLVDWDMWSLRCRRQHLAG